MSLMENFNEFYFNLDSTGLFWFWIIIFIFFFFLFLSIILLIKNRELKILVSMQKQELKDIMTIKEASENSKVKEEETINNDLKEANGPYSKNVLREIKDRDQTSPIHIIRDDEINLSQLEDENIDTDLEINKDKDNINFVEEVSQKLEQELEPKTIELTDYEKKQEEEAIISYQELLTKKDKLYNITEEEETENFIDELKNFRLDLP